MKKHRMAWLGVAAISLMVAGCSNTTSDVVESSNVRATLVGLEQVAEEPLNTAYDLSGTLQAFEERALSFEYGGRVADASFEAGSPIQQGAVLASITEADYRLQLEQADAAIMEAEGALSSAEAGIQTAAASRSSAEARVANATASVRKVKNGARTQEKAQAEAAAEQAKRAYEQAKLQKERIRQLLQAGAASAADFEAAELGEINAQKDWERAQSSLSLILEGATSEDIDAANAVLQEAKAGLGVADASYQQALAAKTQASAAYEKAMTARKQAELALSRTILKAPFHGVVLEKLIQPGELMQAGQPVYRVGNIDQLKLLLPVPDSEIQQWSKGQSVEVSLYGSTRTAKVSQISAATNNGTGTINVELLISNPEHDWLPGQVVKAASQTTGQKGILLPAEAVISTGDQPYVFKSENGTAVKTPVTLGSQMINNQLSIVSGLQDGDLIVTKGATKVFEGDSLNEAEGATP